MAETLRLEASKEAMREHIRKRVAAELDPLLDAAIASARGLKYLVSRDPKTGIFRPVDDVSRIKDATEIWLKQPSAQLFTDLLNRAVDKPAEQVQEVNLSGQLDIVTILNRRRARTDADAQS